MRPISRAGALGYRTSYSWHWPNDQSRSATIYHSYPVPPMPRADRGQCRRPSFVDTGAGLYGCKASADLFGLTKDDLIDQVKEIITVGEFYDLAAGGEIIFT